MFQLRSILDNPKVIKYGMEEQNFALRFFVSSFSGYGLHSDRMLTLAQFRGLLRGRQITSVAERGASQVVWVSK